MAIDGARSKRPISANISRVFLGHHIAIGQYAGMDFPESQRCSQCKRHTLTLSGLRVYRHDVVGNSNGCIECSVTNGHRFQNHAGKNQFPREALVVSGIYQTIFNALIKVALLLIALLVMGIHPDWSLLLFPIGVLALILVGTLIGLALTPVGLLYADVGKGIPLLMQFLMYLTPVVFAMPKDGLPATLFQLNPLTPLILTARDWLTGFTPEHLGYFVVVNVVSIVLLFMFWVVFRLAMPILIERIGS